MDWVYGLRSQIDLGSSSEGIPHTLAVWPWSSYPPLWTLGSSPKVGSIETSPHIMVWIEGPDICNMLSVMSFLMPKLGASFSINESGPFHHQCSASWSWWALTQLQWVPFKLFLEVGGCQWTTHGKQCESWPPEARQQKICQFFNVTPIQNCREDSISEELFRIF